MGCDFYTIYAVVYKYKDGDTVKQYTYALEDTRDRHYWTYPMRDEDFETEEDYQVRCTTFKDAQMTSALNPYPVKAFYQNDAWLCIESAKQTYLKLAEEQGISSESLLEVYKEGQIILR